MYSDGLLKLPFLPFNIFIKKVLTIYSLTPPKFKIIINAQVFITKFNIVLRTLF